MTRRGRGRGSDGNTLTANWTNTLDALPFPQGAQTVKTKKPPRAEGRTQTGDTSDSSSLLPAPQQRDAPQGSPPLRGGGGGATSRLFLRAEDSRRYLRSFLSPDNCWCRTISDGFLEHIQAHRNPTRTDTVDKHQLPFSLTKTKKNLEPIGPKTFMGFLNLTTV